MERQIRAGPDVLLVREWQDGAVSPTVLIVDDHVGFRTWARSMLETEGFAVVGEAADGASALAAASTLRPDLVLLDMMLPDTSGAAVAVQLDALADPPMVVLVSSRDEADFGDVIGHVRARAFVTKADLSGPRLRALLTGQ
jgi:DNA-binding NarL/FixJ family response regulator